MRFTLPKGDSETSFQDVSGISVELETKKVRIGGENRCDYEVPKRAKYPNLVLKRGFFKDSEILNWCRDTIENLEVTPVIVWVELLNPEQQPLQSFEFVGAWPIKWSISTLNSEQNKVVVETMELRYRYFRITKM